LSDLKTEALERAEKLMREIPGGPGYWGRLYSTIGGALLRERVEEVETLAGGAHFEDLGYLKERATELRAAADELERGEG
jgi:hypothetical protein